MRVAGEEIIRHALEHPEWFLYLGLGGALVVVISGALGSKR